jgi:hypothetical protein
MNSLACKFANKILGNRLFWLSNTAISHLEIYWENGCHESKISIKNIIKILWICEAFGSN